MKYWWNIEILSECSIFKTSTAWNSLIDVYLNMKYENFTPIYDSIIINETLNFQFLKFIAWCSCPHVNRRTGKQLKPCCVYYLLTIHSASNGWMSFLIYHWWCNYSEPGGGHLYLKVGIMLEYKHIENILFVCLFVFSWRGRYCKVSKTAKVKKKVLG